MVMTIVICWMLAAGLVCYFNYACSVVNRDDTEWESLLVDGEVTFYNRLDNSTLKDENESVRPLSS
jgi:hypothetical protein